MTKAPQLSVVIATFNRRDILARTLPTLIAQDFPADEYEVVIVVDGATDGTADLVRDLKSPCTLRLFEQPNKGQAVAQNKGWRAARGRLVLFLDDDILCERALVQEHVSAHRGVDQLVVIGPVLVSPESPHTLAADWMRAADSEYFTRLIRQPSPRWPDDAIVMANVSVPRSALLTSGGFDESLVVAHSSALTDVDLGIRLWNMGLRFRYQPTARASELYVKSARDTVERDAWCYGRNQVILCRKQPDYRRHAWLTRLSKEPPWKHLLRLVAAKSRLSPEAILRGPFWAVEQLRSVPLIRRTGVRLLQRRQAMAMLRGALHETGSWENLRREFLARLPVLLYHHVGPSQPGTFPSLTITPKMFEHQIGTLARQGYVGIRTANWLAWCREGKVLPDKPVLLTFDDGYADLAEYALPVLRSHGFGAIVFVVTGRIGGTNAWDETLGSGTHRLMTAEQIRMWANQGIEFGAHSRTHPDLTSLSGDRLAEEIIGSGRDLTTILGSPPVSFAYPYGLHNESVRSCVSTAFDLAFSTEEGLNDLWTDPHLLQRTMVQPRDRGMDFRCRVYLGWNPIQRLRSKLRARIRHFAGLKK